jgi:small GTP-binding protein
MEKFNEFHGSDQLFDVLARTGTTLPDQYKDSISKCINNVIQYNPVIGIFGKTGTGKSSLCNALFGKAIFEISDTVGCTRDAQEITLNIDKKGLTLVDLPGVGESSMRDQEYDTLYRNHLPKLDMVLWILKGDERAFATDEDFYKRLVKPHLEIGMPFFIVINQVDKIEPFREWNVSARQPSSRQKVNIEEKRRAVAGFFELPIDQVLAVSANEKYGLIELVDSIIHKLPPGKRVSILREIPKTYQSPSAKRETNKGTADAICDFIDETPLPSYAKSAAKSVVRWVSSWF